MAARDAPRKKRFVLDGRKIRSEEDFYDQIDAQIGCPGRNLDALVDVLRGGFGFEAGEEIIVEWRAFGASASFPSKKAILRILDEAPNVEFIKT